MHEWLVIITTTTSVEKKMVYEFLLQIGLCCVGIGYSLLQICLYIFSLIT